MNSGIIVLVSILRLVRMLLVCPRLNWMNYEDACINDIWIFFCEAFFFCYFFFFLLVDWHWVEHVFHHNILIFRYLYFISWAFVLSFFTPYLTLCFWHSAHLVLFISTHWQQTISHAFYLCFYFMTLMLWSFFYEIQTPWDLVNLYN